MICQPHCSFCSLGFQASLLAALCRKPACSPVQHTAGSPMAACLHPSGSLLAVLWQPACISLLAVLWQPAFALAPIANYTPAACNDVNNDNMPIWRTTTFRKWKRKTVHRMKLQNRIFRHSALTSSHKLNLVKFGVMTPNPRWLPDELQLVCSGDCNRTSQAVGLQWALQKDCLGSVFAASTAVGLQLRLQMRCKCSPMPVGGCTWAATAALPAVALPPQCSGGFWCSPRCHSMRVACRVWVVNFRSSSFKRKLSKSWIRLWTLPPPHLF